MQFGDERPSRYEVLFARLSHPFPTSEHVHRLVSTTADGRKFSLSLRERAGLPAIALAAAGVRGPARGAESFRLRPEPFLGGKNRLALLLRPRTVSWRVVRWLRK